MRLLSLFAGIGGIDLGLERAGMTTVAQCEINPFCRKVLAKHWPNVRRFEDVTTLDATGMLGAIDIVAGGFPCQDISVAGNGSGIESGKRSGLWREMARIIGECRPAWVLAENVPALRTRGADIVLADLERLGYTCRSFVVGAWAVGAPHRRDRVWIVANARSVGIPRQVQGIDTFRNGQWRKGCTPTMHDWPTGWMAGPRFNPEGQPTLLGVDDGVPDWVDRVRSIGNAVVPQVVEVIGRWIMQQENTQ